MTRYISTRGQSPAIGFLDAVLAGHNHLLEVVSFATPHPPH